MARVLGPAGLCTVALGFALPGSTPFSAFLACVVFCLAGFMAARSLAHDYPHDRLGLCNYATLLRLLLVSGLTAPVLAGGHLSWLFFGLAGVTLMLDGVDGWLARRHRFVSAFGARFDVEVDSLFALVLAANAAFGTELGLVVLLLGLPRYVFLVATHALPWMNRKLPERLSRKVICVVQIAALIILQAPALPLLAGAVMLLASAVLLIWSFAKDVLWLWHHRG